MKRIPTDSGEGPSVIPRGAVVPLFAATSSFGQGSPAHTGSKWAAIGHDYGWPSSSSLKTSPSPKKTKLLKIVGNKQHNSLSYTRRTDQPLAVLG